jgi:TolB-like protein
VLALLLERPGELVTRDEIKAAVWGDDTSIQFDQGLNFCIKEIRAALADSAEAPHFIETLPRRGYRFITPVEAIPSRREAEPGTRARLAPPARARLALALGLAAAGAAVWLLRVRAGVGASGPLRLAVLPFDNLSGGPGEDDLSDAIGDELVARLGGIEPQRLGVIGRDATASYRGRAKDAGQIGRELRVDYLLEGSVRRGADRVRVTVNLIQVSDGTQLFSDAYEDEAGNGGRLRDTVVRQVARRLELAFSRRL